MSMDKNTTLHPRRRSELTHVELCVDEQLKIYFKFHTWLNPTSVYAVMLRLKQLDWLDSFDMIVCEDISDMWELRKRVPKMAGRIICLYNYGDYSHEMPNAMGRLLYIIASYTYDLDAAVDIDEIEEYVIITYNQLWDVIEITSNYEKQ